MRRPVPGPVALIVLDGWGLAPAGPANAISLAATPVFDRIWEDCPHTTLEASGEAVGLPPGQMGNSNVGHLNLGAGRVVWQDLARIDRAVASGEFFRNPVLRAAVEAGGRVHLIGLCSDGGVHSSLDHLLALLRLCRERGRSGDQVYVHAVTDGRDTPPRSAAGYLERVRRTMDGLGVGRFATVMGRYYAMDRDRRWERTELAYRALLGDGEAAPTAAEAVAAAYGRGETDEFVRPTVVAGAEPLRAQDSVLCFNFRPDRARQITRLVVERSGARFAGMGLYEEDFPQPAAFPRLEVRNGLGEVVSRAGLAQLRVAETEKYAHVTYFFNGMEEDPWPGEERALVPSPRVATYDLQPEMSAAEVAEQGVRGLASGRPRLLVLNFANPDMVGHTGVLSAAVRAVEAADAGLGRVLAEVGALDGAALVLADHGNAEVMVDPETGAPHTAHTTNPVPCVLVGRPGAALRSGGSLADAAPTLLELLGLPQPAEMEGRSLIADDGGT